MNKEYINDKKRYMRRRMKAKIILGTFSAAFVFVELLTNNGGFLG